VTVNIDHTTAGVTTLRAPSSGTATLTLPAVPGSTQMVTIDSSGAFASQTIPSSGSSLTDTAVQTTTYTASAGQNVLLNASGMQSSNTVTFSNGPNYMNYASGLPENGTEVVISNSGGALPGGVTANTRYFITTSTGTIGSSGYTQLSLTRGGSPVDITTDGSGTNTATVISKQVSLPASPSVGDRVRFTLRTADTTRTWLPSFNGSTVNGSSGIEPYRLTQVGEWFEFVCTASNAWQVVGSGKQTSNSVVFANTSRALSNAYADNRLVFDAEQSNCSGMTAVLGGSSSGIQVRRAGKYTVKASLKFGGTSTPEVYLFVYKNSIATGNMIAAAEFAQDGQSSAKVHRAISDEELVAGDVVLVDVVYAGGSLSTNVTNNAYRPTLSMIEIT